MFFRRDFAVLNKSFIWSSGAGLPKISLEESKGEFLLTSINANPLLSNIGRRYYIVARGSELYISLNRSVGDKRIETLSAPKA